MSTPDETAASTAVWDQRYEGGEHVGSRENIEGDPVDYTQHKFLYRHAIAEPTTGSPDGWIIDAIGEKYLTPPPAKMLSIGCGMAFIEEHLARAGFAGHILAYEMSRSAITAAKERVAGQPYADRLELRSGDVLTEDLQTAGFDVVFVQAAIHHFFDIEAMFQLMHRVLKPDGLLIYDEYIGPDHHIYDDHVVAVMDRINACLSPAYRWDHLAKHERQGVPKPDLQWMLQHDPSEGVHASQILPLTHRYFDVIDRRDYGGSIMRPFFTGILPNFDWTDPKDQTVGRLVVLMERLLVEKGAVPSYQTAVVARRRATILPPLSEAEAARINYADWTPPAPQVLQPAPPPPFGLLTRLIGSLVRRVRG
ncbi:class I SAM-dependent methyltransferase [Acidisphaera sp. L21]|uniref:class I SAM-dependent methyltransferase n=1 Tax=Acidisphaera sp. L21 TaxID=1641851 RepID=UPI00131B0259|nr:class I SAM-dependent methyltransferase [Acidisphaera sp. L21]